MRGRSGTPSLIAELLDRNVQRGDGLVRRLGAAFVMTPRTVTGISPRDVVSRAASAATCAVKVAYERRVDDGHPRKLAAYSVPTNRRRSRDGHPQWIEEGGTDGVRQWSANLSRRSTAHMHWRTKKPVNRGRQSASTLKNNPERLEMSGSAATSWRNSLVEDLL